MKRKVKKFAGDEGSVVRTRSDKEFAEDSKFGGYGRYMPKGKEYTLDEAKDKLSSLFRGTSKAKEEAPIEERSKPVEERLKAKGSFGYEDMDGRMPAASTWSGDQSPKAKAKAAPEPEPEVKGPFSRGANPDFESTREVIRGESAVADKDSGGGSKASGTKVKKAKLPSNPNNDSSSYAPPRSQSVAPPSNNRRPTYERTLSIEDRAKMLSDGNRDTAPKKKDDEDYTAKKKRERAGKDVRANSAVYGMKKGGAVKSASARADGCAIRGKTRA